MCVFAQKGAVYMCVNYALCEAHLHIDKHQNDAIHGESFYYTCDLRIHIYVYTTRWRGVTAEDRRVHTCVRACGASEILFFFILLFFTFVFLFFSRTSMVGFLEFEMSYDTYGRIRATFARVRKSLFLNVGYTCVFYVMKIYT